MAKANGNGNDRHLDLLLRIAERLDSIESKIDGTNTRLDGVLKIAGASHRELEKRVAAIEKRLGI